MKYKHIFWDWNGTILDDAAAAHRAVNIMLVARKLNTISFEQYRDFVDVPISLFYERVMDMQKETMEGLSIEYNALWKEELSENPLVFGIKEVLKELAVNGVKQYIYSSSQNKYIEPLLERHGIAKYFTVVLGATDCNVGSKTQRTCEFLIKNGISPSDTVFVGDMVHDSEVAEKANADCILVSYGHQSEEFLNKSNRTVVADVESLKRLLLA